jgi:hypothetical protein
MFYFTFLAKVNICATQPCNNGGFCNSTDGISYTCKCKPGFEGRTCDQRLEQDIKKSSAESPPSIASDPCYSMPCFNLGKCKSSEMGFKCVCEPGFYGIYCEAGEYQIYQWHVGFMLQKLGIVHIKIRHCLQKNISIEK